MALSNMLVQLQKPLKTNKKLFGLITTALLIIGGLSATYYFHIRAKQSNFKEYKLRMLDSYYNKIARKLDNDILKSEAVDISERQKKVMLHFAGIGKMNPTLLEGKNYKHQFSFSNFLKHLKLQEEFTQYIAVLDSSQWSSIPGLYNFNTEFLFRKDTLHTGLIRTIDVNEEQFLLIGRKYLYESSINTQIKKEITLIGLIDGQTYQKETRQLDAWAIALLTAFLMLCLIGLPFFKMVFISEDERLFSSDVILAGISVMVGAPVVLIVFLSLMTYGNDFLMETPRELNTLAQKIKNRFVTENSANIQTLYELDIDQSAHVKYDSLIHLNGSKNLFTPPLERDSGLYEHFKYVSKLDSTGKVAFHINMIQAPPPEKAPVTLKDRSYFKDYTEGKNLWRKDAIDYVVRPVVSIENNTEEVVYILSTKERKRYKVGSAQLKSIHNPILPFGYQFAMVDSKGEVWFHSQEGRSTLENFFSVSKNIEGLKAAINGRASSSGDFDYHGKTQLFYTLPVEGTNLSLITFYDISLIRLRVSEVLSICSMAILVAFLLLGIITLISLYVKNPRWGLYKYHSFLFDYLIPRERKKGHYIFLFLTFCFLLLLISLVGSILDFTPSFSFLSSLLIIIWSYIIVHFILNTPKTKIFIQWSIRETLLVIALMVLNCFIYVFLSEKSSFAVLFILQLIAGSVIYLFSRQNVKAWFTSLSFKTYLGLHFSYKYWYALFLFAWLLLSSLFPTYIFFQKSKAVDDVIWVKTNQYNYTKAYEEKEKLLKTEKLVVPKHQVDFTPIYTMHLDSGSYFLAHYGNLHLEKRLRSGYNQPSVFRQLLWNSRPIYDERIRDFQALIYQQAHDNSWYSSISEQNDIEFRLTHSANHKEDQDVVSNYRNSELNTSLHNSSSGQLFFFRFTKIAGLLLIFSAFYLLILYYVDRFFGFRFKHLKVNDFDVNKETDYLDRFVEVLNATRANNGILLIGTPFSGKGSFAENIMKRGNFEQWGRLSFLQPCEDESASNIEGFLNDSLSIVSNTSSSESNWRNLDVFLLENIEHNLKSFEINRLKLKVIGYLISLDKRIILTSEIYPSQILSNYEDQVNEQGQMVSMIANDYYSWRNLLSSFPQVIIGITDKREYLIEKLSVDPQFVNIPSKEIRSLANELGYSKFLPELASVILSKNIYLSNEKKQRFKLDEQRMIMHILNLSHGYYTDIWNSLPRRERYLLYDLAKDGFVNIKNGNSLFSLMKKGIIIWKDRPTIFNQSFRNFIVSSVSKSEALNYEYKTRGEGSWGTIRIVLYLIILTVIIFIILGEPGLLKDFETFYTAIAGLGAMVPIVSALLARGNSK